MSRQATMGQSPDHSASLRAAGRAEVTTRITAITGAGHSKRRHLEFLWGVECISEVLLEPIFDPVTSWSRRTVRARRRRGSGQRADEPTNSLNIYYISPWGLLILCVALDGCSGYVDARNTTVQAT